MLTCKGHNTVVSLLRGAKMSGGLRPLHVFSCNKKNKMPAYIPDGILRLAEKKGVVVLFEGGHQNSIISFEYVDS